MSTYTALCMVMDRRACRVSEVEWQTMKGRSRQWHGGTGWRDGGMRGGMRRPLTGRQVHKQDDFGHVQSVELRMTIVYLL